MKFKIISDILKVTCFEKERFLFHERELISDFVFMCCIVYKTVSFILKEAPYLRRSYFKNISSKINKVEGENCLKFNEHIENIAHSSCSRMNDDKVSLDNIVASGKKTKKLPNYFIAVQVTDQQVHYSVKLIQDHMLLQNEQLTKCMIARSTMHITLMVLHIKDTDDYSKAIKALSAVYQEYNSIISNEPVRLEFCGLGHFQNRVLYVKLEKNNSYQLLCDLAKKVCIHLEKVGLFSTDKRKEFTPHLTIAKLDLKKKSSRKIKKINPLWYEDFADLYLGCDTIKSLQLLKMQGRKTTLGYYSGDELFFLMNIYTTLK
ncbi:A-kinase anchor protein 7 isoform X1 [Parasteatoda tepidariorum]|uniref:A-kinase anchor protein 7 isoform X1 n=2 Tax=Parasteatoda tepidariorum TaxID=114398 RepID=UPI001C7185A0|nr:A-kinase anchor protein 7 isoform X1 [Parasteatoda tepidariorum]